MYEHFDVVSQRDLCLVASGAKPTTLCFLTFSNSDVFYEKRSDPRLIEEVVLQTRGGEISLGDLAEFFEREGVSWSPMKLESRRINRGKDRSNGSVRHCLQIIVGRDDRACEQLIFNWGGGAPQEDLGYPPRLAVAALNPRRDGKPNNNYNLMRDLVKARDSEQFIPSWPAYVLHVPSKDEVFPHPVPFLPTYLDFSSEDYCETSMKLASQYCKRIAQYKGDLPSLIEQDFEERVQNLHR